MFAIANLSAVLSNIVTGVKIVRMQASYTENIVVGQHFKCDKCGFEVAVVVPCDCESGEPELKCCGETLNMSDPKKTE